VGFNDAHNVGARGGTSHFHGPVRAAGENGGGGAGLTTGCLLHPAFSGEFPGAKNFLG